MNKIIQRYISILPTLTACASAIIVIYVIYHVVMFSRMAAKETAQLAVASVEKTQKDDGADISTLVSLHWFGAENSGQPGMDSPVAAQYELTGIFQGVNEASSYAMIGEKGQAAKLYRLHDGLPDGSVIIHISATSVLLKNGDEEHQLHLRNP